MDLANTVVNVAVVAVVGALVTWILSGRFRHLEREMDRRFDETNRRIERLEDSNSAEHHAIRADLTQVALGIGLRPDAEAGG